MTEDTRLRIVEAAARVYAESNAGTDFEDLVKEIEQYVSDGEI